MAIGRGFAVFKPTHSCIYIYTIFPFRNRPSKWLQLMTYPSPQTPSQGSWADRKRQNLFWSTAAPRHPLPGASTLRQPCNKHILSIPNYSFEQYLVHPTDRLLMLYKYMCALGPLDPSWTMEGGDMHPTTHFLSRHIFIISLSFFVSTQWALWNNKHTIQCMLWYVSEMYLYIGPSWTKKEGKRGNMYPTNYSLCLFAHIYIPVCAHVNKKYMYVIYGYEYIYI